MFLLRPISLAALALCSQQSVFAQTSSAESEAALQTVTVEASADASAQGLAKPFAGGQVARGARVGVLGQRELGEDTVDDARAVIVDHRHRFARRIVGQAEDGDVGGAPVDDLQGIGRQPDRLVGGDRREAGELASGIYAKPGASRAVSGDDEQMADGVCRSAWPCR